MWRAGTLLVAVAGIGAALRIYIITTFLTAIFWTGYILLADAAVYRRRGASLLRTYPGAFAWMTLLSIPLWLVFEAYNLRLRNWEYVGLPENAAARMFGYAWGFATITPCILETADLLLAGKSRSLAWPQASGGSVGVASGLDGARTPATQLLGMTRAALGTTAAAPGSTPAAVGTTPAPTPASLEKTPAELGTTPAASGSTAAPTPASLGKTPAELGATPAAPGSTPAAPDTPAPTPDSLGKTPAELGATPAAPGSTPAALGTAPASTSASHGATPAALAMTGCRPLRWQPAPLIAAGVAALVIPLVAPASVAPYLFGLVWLGFALLLDPLNARAGRPSILGDLGQGEAGRLRALLIAGFVCGVLWEFWNWWATARWVYTFPILQHLKIFEMPAPGYLGFPPFAVDVFAMYVWAAGVLRVPSYEVK